MRFQHPGCDRAFDGVTNPVGTTVVLSPAVRLRGGRQRVDDGASIDPIARDHGAQLKRERVRHLVAAATWGLCSKLGSAVLENGLRPRLAAPVHIARGLAG